MAYKSPKETIVAAQKDWALQAGMTPDSLGYLGSVALNLRQPLSDGTMSAFDKADGGEFRDRNEAPAKMRALHSSSALAVNVFSYWEGRADLTPLLGAMGVDGTAGTIDFERKLPSGARGTPPNLDVVITTADSVMVGVESKFTEWMMPQRALGKSLAPYIKADGSYWSRAGLPRADRIARDVHGAVDVYRRLDVPQLLKHCLGLARASTDGKWVLRYVYFDATGPEADAHHAEIARFTERIAGELDFRAVRYQTLIPAVALDSTVDRDYVLYLNARYAL